MKRYLHACASLLLALLGLNTSHAQSDLVITPQLANPAAVTVGVSFTLTSDFGVASTAVSKSTSSTGMPVWTLSATTVRSVVAIPPTPQKVKLTYAIGSVAPGTTGRLIWKLNGRVYSESNFTVPVVEVPINASAAITVDPFPTASVARVQVLFREYAAIPVQKAPVKEGNRIILEASAERVAVMQIFPLPPLPVANLSFNLEPQPAGEYTAVFKLNGLILSEKAFRIADAPPPITAIVTSTLNSTSAGTNAHVRILLPDPYYAMTAPGTPEISGNSIRINATLSRINTLVALPSPNVLEQDYSLGVLPPGTWNLVYQINTTTKLNQSFIIKNIISNEPNLVSVEAMFLPAPSGGAPLEGAPAAGFWQGTAHLMLMPDLAAAAGPLVKEGNAFKSTIILQQLGRPISIDDKPRAVEVFFNLGSPPAGEYTFAVTLPGSPAQTKQTAFRVVNLPPPALPQLASVEVRKSPDSNAWLADVGIVLTGPNQMITDWGTPVRTGNRFSVALGVGTPVLPVPGLPGGLDGADGELANDPVLQGQAFVALAGDAVPGAVPFRIVRHRYDLGPLDAGLYQFAATAEGKSIGSREFKIRETPPPPGPIVAAIEISKSSAGAWQSTVRLVLPTGQIVTDWGTAVKDGNQFKVSLTTGPAAVTDPPGSANALRSVFSHTYDLGILTEGAYSFTVYQGADQLGLRQFRVMAAPPPPVIQPRLAFIDIKPGTASTAAEAGIILPQPGFSITSWGDVVREGDKLKAIVQVKVDEVIPAVALPPVLQRHTYSLGSLEAGEYKLTLCYQTSPGSTPLVLGARAFKVQGSPPPPDPTPIVACLTNGLSDQGSFLDLCLAWPQPGWSVTEWGTPVREGNQFKATLITGKTTPSPSPTGAFPSLIPADGSINDAMLEPFREIGGWPASLVRHRYLLGLLGPGEYQFKICLGTRVLASKSFTVKNPVISKPLVTTSAEPVRQGGTGAAAFSLTFTARSGWPLDPTLGQVTVKGPHGFVASATRLSGGIISMDPLGILAKGEYEIAPPGGTWEPDDNGRYQIFIDPAAVKDRAGQSPVNPVGSFLVQILPTPPPPPPALKADVTISMADGQWSADVSFENTGGWWKAVWGGVKPRSPVLYAEASLEVLPPFVKMPIPASFSHTFPLGELKPGFYSFLFRSSAGHVGQATITVPGLEPPSPLEAWKLNFLGTSSISDDLADDDHDGQCNLAEFALGGHPRQADSPNYHAEIQQGHLALVYQRAMGSESSVACDVELSANMQDWVPAGPLVSMTTGAPAPDGTQRVCACQIAPLGASRYPYMRLRFQKLGDN